jgi:hemerythrin
MMDRLTCNGDLSVGVKILDFDHREMTEALYEIQEAMRPGEDPRRAGSLLSKLADFSLTHFALEEGMMGATRYPGLARHRANHQRMIQQIKALASRYNEGGAALDRPSLSLLSELHIAHVQTDDLRYGSWLNENCQR